MGKVELFEDLHAGFDFVVPRASFEVPGMHVDERAVGPVFFKAGPKKRWLW